MSLTIKPTTAAAAQIRKESRWWRANRTKAPKLFRDELRRVFELLSAYPNAGALCDDPDLPKHYLYYQLHEEEQSIEVLAVWSTHRGDRPVI